MGDGEAETEADPLLISKKEANDSFHLINQRPSTTAISKCLESFNMTPEYRPMMEKTPSQRKLKKGRVLLSVMKQIKDDTGKLWKSARSLTGTDDDDDEPTPETQDNRRGGVRRADPYDAATATAVTHAK